MEVEGCNYAVTSSKWSSPLIPALYCLFLAEEREKYHLSTQEILFLLVNFYGFRCVPITNKSVEIDLYLARDEHCHLASDILNKPLLNKKGVLKAIGDFKPIGFKSFEQKILTGTN